MFDLVLDFLWISIKIKRRQLKTTDIVNTFYQAVSLQNGIGDSVCTPIYKSLPNAEIITERESL